MSIKNCSTRALITLEHRGREEGGEKKMALHFTGSSKLIRLMMLPLLMKMGILCFSTCFYFFYFLGLLYFFPHFFFHPVPKRRLRVFLFSLSLSLSFRFIFFERSKRTSSVSKITRWSRAIDGRNKKFCLFSSLGFKWLFEVVFVFFFFFF